MAGHRVVMMVVMRTKEVDTEPADIRAIMAVADLRGGARDCERRVVVSFWVHDLVSRNVAMLLGLMSVFLAQCRQSLVL